MMCLLFFALYNLKLVLLFADVVGRITAVTDIVVVHSQHQAEPSDTRSIVLQDQLWVFYLSLLCFSFLLQFTSVNFLVLHYRGNEITLVLWGERAREFDAEDVHAASEKGAVIAIFVGTLPKVYRGNPLVYSLLASKFI
jgi:hypothetical protein